VYKLNFAFLDHRHISTTDHYLVYIVAFHVRQDTLIENI